MLHPGSAASCEEHEVFRHNGEHESAAELRHDDSGQEDKAQG
jgi:hypothetical protein